MLAQVVYDDLFQLVLAAENASLQSLLCQLAEPTLSHAQPRASCSREVDVEARVPLQPCAEVSVFVHGMVVHDQVRIEFGDRLLINTLEKPDPLLVSVPRLVLRDQSAVSDAQRHEQGGCAVASVVVRHRSQSSGKCRYTMYFTVSSGFKTL